MNTEKRTSRINADTKLAWQQNWEEIDIDTILTIFDYPRVKEMLKAYKGFLKREDRIIEAGCGLGPWVIELTRQGYDITGIDYDAASIAKIKSFDKNLRIHVADIRDIPFKDGYFNSYLSFGVLEHFAEGPQQALKEASRVLAPGGLLIVTVPFRNIFIRIKYPIEFIKRNSIIRRIFNKPQKAHYYQRYFPMKQICSLISLAGFTVEKVMPIDHIFSLVSFWSIFRDKSTYDGENAIAVSVAAILKRIMPWQSADSMLIVARKMTDGQIKEFFERHNR